MPPTWTDAEATEHLDTVALLQEEVARLEAELRRRDELASEGPPEPLEVSNEAAEARIGELTALLAERDEAIGLLCDQLAALEEAGAARAAEWEQLDRWVKELEERIDRAPAGTQDSREAFDQIDMLRERLERQERDWEAERGRLEREIAGLRSRLAAAEAPAGGAGLAEPGPEHRRPDDDGRIAALEAEAAQATEHRERARALQTLLDQTSRALDQANDALRCERIEHEAELATLRASLASARASAPAELSPDERIRALRLHFRDIHEHEPPEHEEHQLFGRIARLWRRSAPRERR
jgi:chromosome segregation ATPase